MATPNYEQIQSFGYVKSQLCDAAIAEFSEYLYSGITRDEVIEAAVQVAEKFAMLGAELGAQWYDLCTELAGINAEPAIVDEVDTVGLTERAKATVNGKPTDTIQSAFNLYLQNVINDSVRTTGDANLWRDYERGLTGGRWARVPVGDTCAWCLMLAAQGAWYLSEKSALEGEAGHYHNGCNCIAVYHADPDSIGGYSKLADYKSMYYDADNTRRANDKGRTPYPEELSQRIENAKAVHMLKEAEARARGEDYKQWTVYNEDMIVMRYKYGLK